MENYKMENIFVYGSLMSEYIYKNVVNSTHDDYEKSSGILNNYKRVCVKNRIYPAIIQQQDSTVTGILKKVPVDHLGILDVFEGQEYKRELLEIQIGDSRINAWVYIWNKSINELEIKDWDYVGFLSSQEKWIRNL